MNIRHRQVTKDDEAFTLVELLVATVILVVVIAVLLQLTGGVAQIWKSSAGKISAFQNARAAFTAISRTLSRATLNTYNDYVDVSGNYRTISNSATFVPAQFARASELHFLAGPVSQIVPGADAAKNPGHAIFFQAPLGGTDDNTFRPLNRTLNSIGFYLQYGGPSDSLLPNWLKPSIGSTKHFRLVQFVEPTETLKIYTSTANASYNLTWLDSFKTPVSVSQPRSRALAEDVLLLVLRPRLASEDETIAATKLGVDYSSSKRGSILSPNYHYDSRAWQTGYPETARVKATVSPTVRASLMRNQVPPIVDLAMVCVDRRSLARFNLTSDIPPEQLQVPVALFMDSSKFDADLAAYGKRLSDARISYRLFHTSIQIQGAKWSNN